MQGRAGARHAPGRARLSRSADFDRVFRQGRSHACRELVLYVFPRDADAAPRLGLSVSRKVGGAVQRNRIKRLLREAFALEGARLGPGTDAVVVARAEARTLAERAGLDGIRAALAGLIRQASGGNHTAEVEGEEDGVSVAGNAPGDEGSTPGDERPAAADEESVMGEGRVE